MGDVRTPFPNADERTTLLAFLDYLREAVVRKTEGLDEAALRHSPVPTGTSLLGLVKHLTFVETVWFRFSFTDDEALPHNDLEEGDTAASVVADYDQAIATSRSIVDSIADLDQLARRAGVAPEPMSLRWTLVHLIEETSRHAGHADIVRELLDGETGR